MELQKYFTTSVGKKLIMALTGLFLIAFLVVHCYVNALVFFNDGGKAFEEAAHFMGTNPVIRTTEIGLFVFLFWHAIQGLVLFAKNRSKRQTRYAVAAGNATSKWYSRSMGLLGTLILMFLIMHLWHFWVPNRGSQIMGNGEINLFHKMDAVFENVVVVVVYVLGCISLAYHLLHGFYSAFQTLGMATFKYKGIIKCIGVAFSILVPLVFALMPIAFYCNWVS